MLKRYLILACFCAGMAGRLLAAEEDTWCLLTDAGDALPMQQVVCLVAADDDVTFGVLLKDGNVIDGVRKATFGQTNPTAIKGVGQTPVHVSKDLTLEGVPATTPVFVYTTKAELVRKATAASVQLADLPAGIYLININKTTFKICKE